MPIASVNPANGQLLRSFDALDDRQLEEKIALALSAFSSWRCTPIPLRLVPLATAAQRLEHDAARLGRIMTLEMGKPLLASIAEVRKCALACRYYVDNAQRLLADESHPTDADRSFVRFQPLGPILAVMPWNFPFWQVFRFLAPALAAGNVGLLKHASNVPQCALEIERILLDAGLPPGVFQTLLIPASKVDRILADPRVAAATLTGSVDAGRQVASHAGSHLKKTVLELGGSDPFIVMPSASLDEAVRVGVDARILNNGQSCIAAKRFIVAEPVYEAFLGKFVERMRALRVGDPLDDSTQLGPLATESVLVDLDHQVRQSLAAGARCLTGGHRLERPGLFYAPTVLDRIPPGCPAWSDELFGPVAAVFRARDLDHAVELANATRFGLGASAWSNDPGEIESLAERIDAGMVFVNRMVVSDPRIPFGGIKESGYGRELGTLGIREFVNAKTVVIRNGGETRALRTE